MRLGMVTTYAPRRGRLSDPAVELVRGLAALEPDQRVETLVCAVDRHRLDYPDEVVAVVAQDRADDYRRAATILAEHGVDVALIQFEAEIYGSNILDLVHELRRRDVPYLVSLHGLRRAIDPTTARTVAALTAHAARVHVRTTDARSLVIEQGMALPDRLSVVPVGVPAIVAAATTHRPAPTSPRLADLLRDLGGQRLITTLGPRLDGLEAGLAAVASLVVSHPDLHYVVAGTAADDGYAERLRELADGFGLADRLHLLVDEYLTPPDFAALLGRTEVYLGANLPADRTCSGSLTYAVVAECPSVAPEYPYTVELLGSGAGILTADFAAALAELLDAPARRAAARRRAAAMATGLAWPAVGTRLVAHLRAAGGPPSPVEPPHGNPDAASPPPASPPPSARPVDPNELLALAHRLLSAPAAELPALAQRLDAARSAAARPGWPWFGERLQGGAVLAHALIAAGRRLRDAAMLDRGVRSLCWYIERAGLGAADGVLRPPARTGVPAAEDAAATVEALVEAHLGTGRWHYARLAQRAFGWFVGANADGVAVYDDQTGTCRAGLEPGPASVPATLAYHAAARAVAVLRLDPARQLAGIVRSQ